MPKVKAKNEDLARIVGLEVLVGEQVTEIISLRKKIVKVGRSPDADVQLLDTEVSSLHCRFELVNENYQVFDCHSTNGTLVNGQKTVKAKLKVGDVIKIGASVFRYFESKQVADFVLRNAFEPEKLSGIALKEQQKINDLLQKKQDHILKNLRLHFVGNWADGTHSELKVDQVTEVLGRSCDLGHFAIDEELSRKHAQVSVDENGACYIEDLESLNGTYVNGARVPQKVQIHSKDEIRIGNTRFRVLLWKREQEI